MLGAYMLRTMCVDCVIFYCCIGVGLHSWTCMLLGSLLLCFFCVFVCVSSVAFAPFVHACCTLVWGVFWYCLMFEAFCLYVVV